MKIVAAKQILKANDQLADKKRAEFDAQHTLAINVMGSPGAGKTTLLEAIFREIPDSLQPAVIEGDLAEAIDAERIQQLGIPVVQINTEGACHLDANMIAAADEQFSDRDIDLLFIENVGNLVCTAGFDLGEHVRVVLLSVSEGDDKIVKYPTIFQRCDALIVTKSDLQPHMDFNFSRVQADMQRLAPKADIFQVSARTGQGILDVACWIGEHLESRHMSLSS